MNDISRYFVRQEAEDVLEGNGDSELGKGRGEVILAIEDEEMLRDFLHTVLGESGYTVMLAADGTEGYQTYMKNMGEIDLVLLDMGLPGMSGEDVLSGILSSNPGAKVISMSGYIEPEVQAQALRNGAVDYLPKPYFMEDLLSKLHRTLHRSLQLAV